MGIYEISKNEFKTVKLMSFINKLCYKTSTNQYFSFNNLLPTYSDSEYGLGMLRHLVDDRVVYDDSKTIYETDLFRVYPLVEKVSDDFKIDEVLSSGNSEYLIGVLETKTDQIHAVVILWNKCIPTVQPYELIHINNGDWRYIDGPIKL